MLYRELQPRASLARLVECFWILEGTAVASDQQPERILPDGCVEVVLNLRAPMQELKPGGEDELQPRHFLVGQMTRPVIIKPTGAVELIGIRFHPGGTYPFFKFPMHETTNQVVDLFALSSELARDLTDAVESNAVLPLKVEALQKVLVKRVHDSKPTPSLVGLAADVVRNAGKVSLDALARAAGLSNRQLERRFTYEIGLGPKMFCRILRFQEVFRAVDRDDPNWAAIASDCGYYDQAHLIRDFQQFAEQTPATLLSASSDLTHAFTRKHR
ncbi:MAG TPA: AraC family transcriptional regulator [Blastocatellia bacterium]|nr:AraC family transcriptional regulator [Blastocatellia bacterium]